MKKPDDSIWNKKEIDKAARIISRAKEKKTKTIKFLDSIVYWIVLVIGVIGNLIISITLIPILLTLNSIALYFIIIIIGLSFGLLFEILVRDIENIEKKHHLIISTIIPLFAIINFVVVTIIAGKLEINFMINNVKHMPFLVALVYSLSFIVPYIVYHFIKKE
ncbi:hypothetical protein J4209_06250 [Candidatus Woesearchaeota archaeon]|nr:hypothetical protein [Candidatus Woesearchaeota archaeon]